MRPCFSWTSIECWAARRVLARMIKTRPFLVGFTRYAFCTFRTERQEIGVRAGAGASAGFDGDFGSGFCILSSTMLGLHGNIPVAAKEDLMFVSVKLATQAE